MKYLLGLVLLALIACENDSDCKMCIETIYGDNFYSVHDYIICGDYKRIDTVTDDNGKIYIIKLDCQ